MKCINCGYELPDGSQFCNNCGTKQSVNTELKTEQEIEIKQDLNKGQPDEEVLKSAASKPAADKKVSAINKQTKMILGLCFTGLVLFLAFTLFNNPVSKFVKAVEAENVVQAKEIFEAKINSDDDLAKLVTEIDKKTSKIYDAFISGSLTYEEAKAQTNNYSSAVSTSISNKSQIPETLSAIEDVNNSRVNFLSGKQYLEKNDYVNAINMFLKVVEDDTNYKEARANIEEIKPKYRELLLEEINKMSGSSKYTEALGLVDDGLLIFSEDPELNGLKQNITIAESNYLAQQKKNEEAKKKENAKSGQLVTVEKTKVLIQSDDWKTLYPDLFSATIHNNSGKTLKSYIVSMLAWDANGYPLKIETLFYGGDYEYGGSADNVNVMDGEIYGSDMGWDLMEGHRIVKTKAVVVEAEFYDGSSWKNPYYDYFIEDYMGKPYVD